MIIRIDESISPRMVTTMAASVGARIEYRNGEVTITRRPPVAVTLQHYNRVLEQVRAAESRP